ncbi:hypothetical protein LguiB_006344 [Lonicera macranthoides]
MVNHNKLNSSNRTCGERIMVFGTETEDIRFLPHPGPKRCYYREEEHENMHLLGTREHLCLCHVLQGQLIYVWVLEDYSNWVWDRRYKVNLNWDVNRFPFNSVNGYIPRYNPKFLKVLGIHNGELVIAWDLRGIFSYNLEHNTVSKVEITVEGSSTLPLPFVSAYTKSFVSLSSFIILFKKGPVTPLPDDITVEILSRLPFNCVLECQRVSKKWRALTSSPSFTELHLKRSTTTPSLFLHRVMYGPHNQLTFFIYDKAGQKAHEKKSVITEVQQRSGPILYHYDPMVLGSCNGLLMFLATRSVSLIFVLNPITQELITLPAPCGLCTPCGIYFHPSTREFKLLFSVYKDESCLNFYYTYSLKSKICKQLNYSSSCKTRRSPPPILVNGSLHWMVNRNKIKNRNDTSNRSCTDAIMVFDTETEDFQVLPHPGPRSCYYWEEEHAHMYLLGMREHLCLCHVSRDQVIYVWVLEDYANWIWDRRYKVNLDWDVNHFPFECMNYIPNYNPMFVTVLGIHDGELVIAWDLRGVYAYNLEQNTVSKIEFKVERSSMLLLQYASVYTKSLVSLRQDGSRVLAMAATYLGSTGQSMYYILSEEPG